MHMARPKQGARVAFILLLGVMITSACNRPFSPAPTVTPIGGNPTSLFPSPITTQLSMSEIANLGTQTALASAMASSGTPQAIATQTITIGTQDLSASLTPSPLVTTNPAFTSTSTLAAPATLGTPNTAAPAGPRPAEWQLRKGEFPYCIARRFDVDPQALLSLNGLSNGNILYPGRILKIPQSGSFPGDRALTPHPQGTIYRVSSSSESLYSIACHYGDVRPETIAQVNNLTSADVALTAGQQLTIP
jgi:LysM repeat protein